VQLVYAEQRQIKRALLIVDVQNSFLDDGQLPVPRGGDVVPVINKIRQEHGKEFSLVVRKIAFSLWSRAGGLFYVCWSTWCD
jgi:hypothetical protein